MIAGGRITKIQLIDFEIQFLKILISFADADTTVPGERNYQPHVFQQSVTLTARMWHGVSS